MSFWKYTITVTISLLTLLWSSDAAEAGWLIDHERFHVSVHGQLSCQDCHGEIKEVTRHPDPVSVNRSSADFFEPGVCAACHEEVIEEVTEGRHGGQEAMPWQRYDICIECHNPHYQTLEKDDTSLAMLRRPAEEKCSQCHDFKSELPDFSEEDQPCLQCHLTVSGDHPMAVRKTADLCFHCHGSTDRQAGSFPLIDEAQYASTPHKDINCLVCHPQATDFKHGDQALGKCTQCHRPHDEKIAHDLHSAVTCGACHLNNVKPVRELKNQHVMWQGIRHSDRVSPIHLMQVPQKDRSCRSCHTSGNAIGAVALVLPAKGIICMPCHAATVSVGDTTTALSLVLFCAGFLVVGSMWLSGGNQKVSPWFKLVQSSTAAVRTIFSSRILAIVMSLILEGLLQRRLYRISRERWLLHALVFYPFLFRFIWGIWALIASLQWPQWPGTWVMLDKNHPLTAFLFDLSGMMIVVGIIAMIIRKVQKRSEAAYSALPASDWPAYLLLGSMMITGFILEGMRMAMTGSPDGAPYAFVGDAVSRLLTGYELTGVYGYMWYLHAILTGLFVVYLPFSRMLHMVMAPVVLAMNAASNIHR